MLDSLFALFAQSLFGKVDGPEDGLLEQPLRRRIYHLIQHRPGIHASELCRESGEAWGTVQYHLTLLRKGSLVTSLEAGRERRFFAPDVEPQKARLLAVLNQGRRHEIVQFIRSNPGIRQVDVCEAVDVSRKTFRASIRPLVERGLVVERKGLQNNRYYIHEALEQALADVPAEVPAGLPAADGLSLPGPGLGPGADGYS